jgi:hypothetical protein
MNHIFHSNKSCKAPNSQSPGSEKNENESNFKVYDLTNGEDLATEIFYMSTHAS